ncbi:MAG: iron transporter [Bauldia sp.]|nr:iron transporter [Bauldia sp.]
MDRFHFSGALTATGFIILSVGEAFAIEYPISEPQHGGGLEVAAVYLQPIEMDPPGVMRPAADSDIHLEADIHALADNPNGFGEGEWIPYLVVEFELTKVGSDESVSGRLMPMVASDGPHYGDNISLFGAGSYRLKFTVSPPNADPMAHFGRHIDKETGVAAWFEPFTTEYEFTYAGTGKKGAY